MLLLVRTPDCTATGSQAPMEKLAKEQVLQLTLHLANAQLPEELSSLPCVGLVPGGAITSALRV
jgi:hypothetical protein